MRPNRMSSLMKVTRRIPNIQRSLVTNANESGK